MLPLHVCEFVDFFSNISDQKVEDEPPAKLLDDLFKKTKTIPCIYWLPLTEEQVTFQI